MAFCGLIIGLSTNYAMLVAFLILMGIMGGGYHPSASPLISSAVDKKVRGRVLGIHQVGGTGSFFIAPLIAVAIARVIGWRGSFISVSVPTLAYGFVILILLNRWGFTESTTKNKSDEKAHVDEEKVQLGRLMPVMILAVCVQIFVYSAISFIPLYVVDHFGGSKEAAAAILSIAHSAGIWAGPLAGYLSDRIGKIPIIIFTGIIAGPFIYLLRHVSLGISISSIVLLLGMTQYMSMPVTEVYVITNVPEKNRSTMLGAYYFASRGGPGLLAPVIGYLIDRHSFSTGYLIAGVVMGIIGVICTLIIVLSKK
jgi:predicted MFS family arabinose efflux permease